MDIVAVGFDPPSDTHPWAIDEGFQYEVWTDDDHLLALTYGAVSSTTQNSPARVTVILDENGDLVLEYPQVNFSTSPGLVLEDCQALFGP